jgi:nitrate reductase delta subunit
MLRDTTPDPALAAFAELLTYPAVDPTPVARWCQSVARPRAASHLEGFVTLARAGAPHELEEAYAAAFDLEPRCVPYVGYHLFGDGPHRGEFMARLAGVYASAGFTPEASGELPDHLSVVLRFLAAVPAGEERDALLEDGLRPALDKMLAALADPANAYRQVLEALREELA